VKLARQRKSKTKGVLVPQNMLVKHAAEAAGHTGHILLHVRIMWHTLVANMPHIDGHTAPCALAHHTACCATTQYFWEE
jgi:hypothetical protein